MPRIKIGSSNVEERFENTNPTYLHQYTVALGSKFQDTMTPRFSQLPPQRPPPYDSIEYGGEIKNECNRDKDHDLESRRNRADTDGASFSFVSMVH